MRKKIIVICDLPVSEDLAYFEWTLFISKLNKFYILHTGYEKRARPYSFGLGKRFADDETSEEKRARAYDFGLGKRLPMYNFGLGKRARSYNFGLGKRLSSKFNFGLGKRERDMHRFSFGLGKRSADDASVEDSDNYFDV